MSAAVVVSVEHGVEGIAVGAVFEIEICSLCSQAKAPVVKRHNGIRSRLVGKVGEGLDSTTRVSDQCRDEPLVTGYSLCGPSACSAARIAWRPVGPE